MADDLTLKATITAEDESAPGFEGITSRLDALVAKMSEAQQAIVEAVNRSAESTDHLKDKIGEAGASFGEFATKAAEVVASLFTIEKAFEGVIEGIRHVDEIRDLTLSMGVFSGSAAKGREEMEFFD